jgi:hypothetical protein
MTYGNSLCLPEVNTGCPEQKVQARHCRDLQTGMSQAGPDEPLFPPAGLESNQATGPRIQLALRCCFYVYCCLARAQRHSFGI